MVVEGDVVVGNVEADVTSVVDVVVLDEGGAVGGPGRGVIPLKTKLLALQSQ